MKTLYDQVHHLSLAIVNASLENDTRYEWECYQQLKQLCEQYENMVDDHPLQWEALADFTTNHLQALILYRKALNIAEKLELTDYCVSIYFSMAQMYKNIGDVSSSFECANKADHLAKNISDLELKKEISQFLLQLDLSI